MRGGSSHVGPASPDCFPKSCSKSSMILNTWRVLVICSLFVIWDFLHCCIFSTTPARPISCKDDKGCWWWWWCQPCGGGWSIFSCGTSQLVDDNFIKCKTGLHILYQDGWWSDWYQSSKSVSAKTGQRPLVIGQWPIRHWVFTVDCCCGSELWSLSSKLDNLDKFCSSKKPRLLVNNLYCYPATFMGKEVVGPVHFPVLLLGHHLCHCGCITLHLVHAFLAFQPV